MKEIDLLLYKLIKELTAEEQQELLMQLQLKKSVKGFDDYMENNKEKK